MKAIWKGIERTLELMPETEADQSELRDLLTLSRLIFNPLTMEESGVNVSSPMVLEKVTLLRRS
jgi:hypothetical protein